MGTPWGGEIHSREARWGVGVSPTISLWYVPPRMAPISGVLRRNLPRKFGSIAGHLSTEFYRFFGLSWETSSHSRVLFTRLLVYMATCFFSRWCPPEELDNKRSSARRGEFDSSTPEVIGVLLGQIFLARRFRVVLVDSRDLS